MMNCEGMGNVLEAIFRDVYGKDFKHAMSQWRIGYDMSYAKDRCEVVFHIPYTYTQNPDQVKKTIDKIREEFPPSHEHRRLKRELETLKIKHSELKEIVRVADGYKPFNRWPKFTSSAR